VLVVAYYSFVEEVEALPPTLQAVTFDQALGSPDPDLNREAARVMFHRELDTPRPIAIRWSGYRQRFAGVLVPEKVRLRAFPS
jgi:hypothetical protein